MDISGSSAAMGEQGSVRKATEALLRAVVAHPSLLEPGAVADIARQLATVAAFDQLLIITADANRQLRAYCQGARGDAMLPWAQRLDGPVDVDQASVIDREPSANEPLGQLLTDGGVARYSLAAMRRGEQSIGLLVLASMDAGRSVNLERTVLAQLADLLGAFLLRDRLGQRLVGERLAVQGAMAALGTLAGGLVHEINNPCTFITLAAGQLKKVAASEGPMAQMCDGILESTVQVQRLMESYRLLSRATRDSNVMTIDLARVAQAALHLVSASRRQSTTFECEIEPMPSAHGRCLLIGPALVNILWNAAEAATGSGRPHVVRLTGRAEGGVTRLQVTDNGTGISPEVLPRVFEPFFTTRDAKVHSGLGLTVARELVESLGGSIRISSEVGGGTTVELELQGEVE